MATEKIIKEQWQREISLEDDKIAASDAPHSVAEEGGKTDSVAEEGDGKEKIQTSLERLERDIAAKTSVRYTPAPATPEVVSHEDIGEFQDEPEDNREFQDEPITPPYSLDQMQEPTEEMEATTIPRSEWLPTDDYIPGDAFEDPPPPTVEYIQGEAQEALIAVAVEPAIEGEVIEEEDIKSVRKKILVCLLRSFCCLVIVVVVITVPVAVKKSRPGVVMPTVAPSAAPSAAPSFAPTSVEFFDYLDAVYPLSGQEPFTNRSSPQYLALKWIYDEDELPPEDRNFVQRYTLAVFYYSTGGWNWTACSQGDAVCRDNKVAYLTTGVDECEWFGNKCNGGWRVNQLQFGTNIGNNLVGTIPHEIAHLSQLHFIDMTNNHLYGTLPHTFGNLTNLTNLYLYNNSLETPFPDSFFQLPKLKSLVIYGNEFGGMIPYQLGDMTSLENLNIAMNRFEGRIPMELSRLKNLTQLYLSENRLNGTFPDEIYTIPGLRDIRIGSNPELGGTLPPELGQLSDLTIFSALDCNFTGTVPDAVFNLTRMERWNLAGNLFEGTLSTLFGDLVQLTHLDLSGNDFNGTIPEELGDLPLEELKLNNNSLKGEMPSSICAIRGNSSKSLRVLEADCGGDPPQVLCTCCTRCF